MKGRARMDVKSEMSQSEASDRFIEAAQKSPEYSDLEKRPEIVLSLLEPDQLVVAKERTRFGLRPLSLRIRLQLWALRIYVIIMMIIVALSVYRAIQGVR